MKSGWIDVDDDFGGIFMGELDLVLIVRGVSESAEGCCLITFPWLRVRDPSLSEIFDIACFVF